jgi:hypothetical protein
MPMRKAMRQQRGSKDYSTEQSQNTYKDNPNTRHLLMHYGDHPNFLIVVLTIKIASS